MNIIEKVISIHKLNLSYTILKTFLSSLTISEIFLLASLDRYIHDFIYRFYYWRLNPNHHNHAPDDDDTKDNEYKLILMSNRVGIKLAKLWPPFEYIDHLQIPCLNNHLFRIDQMNRCMNIHEDYSVVYIDSSIGWGVFSNVVITPGQILFPYYGEYISTYETKRRVNNMMLTLQQNNKKMKMMMMMKQQYSTATTVAIKASTSKSTTDTVNTTTSVTNDDDATTTVKPSTTPVAGITVTADVIVPMNYILTIREHIPADIKHTKDCDIDDANADDNDDSGDDDHDNVDNSDGDRVNVLISNIDATYKGNIGRFVNHSCAHNMIITMYRYRSKDDSSSIHDDNDNGVIVVDHGNNDDGDLNNNGVSHNVMDAARKLIGIPVFKASRVIAPGEELTFDYGYSDVDKIISVMSESSPRNIKGDNNDDGDSDDGGDDDVRDRRYGSMLGKRRSRVWNDDLHPTNDDIAGDDDDDGDDDGYDASAGDDHDIVHPVETMKRKICSCGSNNCRGYLPFCPP